MGTSPIELHDSRLEALDIEGLLAFAQEVVTDSARLWLEAVHDQKVKLQQVFFPEGVHFDGNRFGTAAARLAFSNFGEKSAVETVWRPQRELL
jgi:hypothetical protein